MKFTADDLRHWADYIDNPVFPKPAGVNPARAPDFVKALEAVRIVANSAKVDAKNRTNINHLSQITSIINNELRKAYSVDPNN